MNLYLVALKPASMKPSAVLLFSACISLASCTTNENKATNNDTPKTVTAKTITPYTLPIPDAWTTEIIQFPIDFAPGIPFHGTEDLRFAKGWGDITSEEHWAYAFLWWLDGKQQISDTVLQQYLAEYYSGLVKKNIVERSIPQLKQVPTTAHIRTTTTASNDIATYTGTIEMLDYLAQTPMTLNIVIHQKDCAADKTALLIQISPKPADHAVWKALEAVNEGFVCK